MRKAGFHDRTVLISWMDAAVGALVKQLKESGVMENTLIVFASDHQSIGKNMLNGGCHAPAIIAGPRVLQGESNALVANIDILPTIASYCGFEIPKHHGQSEIVIDGVDATAIFSDPQSQVRDELLLEVGYARGLVTSDNWKYISYRYDRKNAERVKGGKTTYPDGVENLRFWKSHKYSSDHFPHFLDVDQMYTLSADPAEKKNLFGKAEFQKRQGQLKRKFQQQLKKLPFGFGEYTD